MVNTVTIDTEDLSSIEEKASDLSGAIAAIRRLAADKPSLVEPLLAAVEAGLDSLAIDLHEIKSSRQHHAKA